jgi:hypothetical protein
MRTLFFVSEIDCGLKNTGISPTSLKWQRRSCWRKNRMSLEQRTGNLVLQRRSDNPVSFYDTTRPGATFEEIMNRGSRNSGGSGKGDSDRGGADAREVDKGLEDGGSLYLHSLERIAVIEGVGQRREAYTALARTIVDEVHEDPIQKDPFSYLGLSNRATFAQVRAAYLQLSRENHPDRFQSHNLVERARIFGLDPKDFNALDLEASGWAKPQVLSKTGVALLSDEEAAAYLARHEEYNQKQNRYEALMRDLQARRVKKMQAINTAYAAARETFSEKAVRSLAGYAWQQGRKVSLSGLEFGYEFLDLEWLGEIRRSDDELFIEYRKPYLAFDHGAVYCEREDDLRQTLPLDEFFIWADLQQHSDFSPLLLKPIQEETTLTQEQVEILRAMIINQEDPAVIVGAVQLQTEEYVRKMQRFVRAVQEGPIYTHLVGIRAIVSYPLGVELTKEGGLILTYKAQKDPVRDKVVIEREAQFTPTDFTLMRAIAYGPLINNNG